MYQELIRRELNEALQTLEAFINDDKHIQYIESAAKLISKQLKFGNKIITCGNGGSHCDAMHFAEELTGFYREYRLGYPAIAISDSSYISCVSNDLGYEQIFSRYIQAIGKQGDVLIGISTSGKSDNILKAISMAHNKKMKIIALTGKKNNEITNNVDIEINVEYFKYADRIQEIHIKVIHILILLIEKEMQVDKNIKMIYST